MSKKPLPGAIDASQARCWTKSSSCTAVEEVASYDSISQIRTAVWRVPDGANGGRELAPLRLRLIFPQELLLLLKAAGLNLRARFGDFSGHPLTEASLNQVCIAGARDDGWTGFDHSCLRGLRDWRDR